jgi:hypothetical protein
MARKTPTRREWTKEDVRVLKALTKEGAKRSVIAHKLKRTESSTRQKAYSLGLRALAKKSRKA